ncbi:MAG: putative glycolipid-binding domain-containing protein [Acidimicrobiales bacterium]|nr:putative glycolipid-binding domain-containing protein [Acidimicrobiales bacterium]
MTQRGVEYHVVWHCSELSSSEHASIVESKDGYRLQGIVVVPLGDLPCHIDYAVSVDHTWRPREARATIVTPLGIREIDLRSHHPDGWELDGMPASHLGDCHDIDLGWTPATNTIPIRRLGLEVGETSAITAAWVRFPELDVVGNQQRYTRLASDRWRYESGDYDFELVTDAATGLVLAYGDDLWQASAISLG